LQQENSRHHHKQTEYTAQLEKMPKQEH
jgi:hypothetical protein